MKTLLTGYKAGDLTPELLKGDVTCHVLDLYHRHAIEKVFHGQVKALCSAHLPEGPWDLIRFRTGPKLMSGELALDMLQECVRAVGVENFKRKVVVDYVGKERDRNDLIDKVKDRVDREFAAKWFASVPNGPKLEFTSYPGCFCHRRQDEGGLALAEVVTKDLQQSVNRLIGQSVNLLDMGSGCGLVGLLIKSVIPELRLTMVDSHTRAIEAAEENAKRFAMPAEIILADNGIPERLNGTFDVFVGNPPYYSDYRIAEVFLETAQRALKKGGVCYTVCKNAEGLRPVQEKYFSKVEIIKRRGYAVLKSQVE